MTLIVCKADENHPTAVVAERYYFLREFGSLVALYQASEPILDLDIKTFLEIFDNELNALCIHALQTTIYQPLPHAADPDLLDQLRNGLSQHKNRCKH